MTDTSQVAIRFHGGPQNGRICASSDYHVDDETIEFPYESYLAMWEGGDVRIITGALGDDWFSTTASIYRKREEQTSTEALDYDFIRNREIGRCAAKGRHQCSNAAIEGELLCPTHFAKATEPRQVSDRHLLAELKDIAKTGRLQRHLASRRPATTE
jgi:hypothetical protein